MRKLLLASHGPLAQSMRETVQMFCGEDSRIKVLCAYIDSASMDVDELIDFWEKTREDGDEWIVLTDIYGGSVNNAFMNRLSDPSLRECPFRWCWRYLLVSIRWMTRGCGHW